MPARNLSQISIPVALLLAELFQCFSSQLAKIFQLHSSTRYNRFETMSREINPKRRWGFILKRMMKDAGISFRILQQKMGPGTKSFTNLNEVTKGKQSLEEEDVRSWVDACGYSMLDFYAMNQLYESGGEEMLNKFYPPKNPSKSHR